ncbi:SDR family NAD(P)-dependent oxidoreductase [Acinetobacter sp. ANC 4216]|uniref:SDR family NAD(P)-dependent oxidoreductase n=1 Tax=unclassified Acinetobacter TaxID=196816 RepID=UPI00103B7F42|nr:MULTISPECIES: SDR family NAD(P)-dependent oxidoreductase [unclassified Acinetobacter]MCT8089350.1 SDR family NAD(P)-dependent oxidoreductase [Acinetobacter sp. F_3_1]MCT8096593.1 SDR family NAD(P)-dependent oxidoreductase [Acinetobacter sp. C_3_1]MCT8100985.1 SDR family NAD(P)-dependent oxidoreductase [Acinetobacter sp. C_4_1]MCT8134700.1 SDR family NAD(P)-dependent oxidoreductase [Acinetobacter sp. T_3_1]TCB70898.1 SDR family NAD(P)-dependent oxidoreductase [Acinetobacter sp. ANC 4216]
MKNFKNKVAAITGAGSGIGQQLAVLLAQQGCHLSLSDVNEQGLAKTVELVKDSHVRVTTKKVNVAKLEEVRDWAAETVQDHGSVNMIFNNAGVALGSTVEGASYEELEWIVNINFWGVVYGTKEFLPLIKQSGEGHIINISSLFGLTAQPTQSAYNATKFAVRGFTESLRQELDLENCGVSALCVHPGGIRTNIANAAKMNDSIRTLGMHPEKSARSFNKLLRCPPEEAARQIIEAVQKDKRRLLIGNDAKTLDLIQRILPTGYQRVTAFATRLSNKGKKSA